MAKIIPAILAHSLAEATEKLRSVEPFVDLVQLDCLDGHFVGNTSFFETTLVEEIPPACGIELHLMVQHPQPIIERWRSYPACRRVIWHIEAPVNHLELLRLCRHAGIEAGLAISPGTSLDQLTPFLSLIDTALILGVHPGWSGQPFLEQTYDTLDRLHEQAPTLPLGVDGGVDEQTISRLVAHRVSYLYTASALFSHPPLAERLPFLEHLASSL
jgi:ribulose-phosphate 3-epimerase